MYPKSESSVPLLPRRAPTNGRVILVNPEHPENAAAAMPVTLDGIVTDISPLQPLNAHAPMLVTLDGIITEVSPLQPANA